MSKAKTGLVVSAHPGDFVWRAGGAIALHAKKGYRVKIVCLVLRRARRDRSSPGSRRARRWTRSRLAGRTKPSARRQSLGAEIEFFDGGDYPLQLTEAHMERLIDIYRELNPSFVLTHRAGRSLQFRSSRSDRAPRRRPASSRRRWGTSLKRNTATPRRRCSCSSRISRRCAISSRR